MGSGDGVAVRISPFRRHTPDVGQSLIGISAMGNFFFLLHTLGGMVHGGVSHTCIVRFLFWGVGFSERRTFLFCGFERLESMGTRTLSWKC